MFISSLVAGFLVYDPAFDKSFEIVQNARHSLRLVMPSTWKSKSGPKQLTSSLELHKSKPGYQQQQ
jgi:hypothetical protein